MSDGGLHPAGLAFTAVLVWASVSLSVRMIGWARTPQRVPVTLTPAPATRTGVVGRLAIELFGFRSLLRASPVTWWASMAMHYGLLAVLLVHLRFVIPVLPVWMVPVLQSSGIAVLVMLSGTLVLLLRRLVVDRVRWISVPSDFGHLVLLLAIVLSGAALKRLWPTDLQAVGTWLRGTLTFDWQPLPASGGLWLHLALVTLLIAIFPISKLVHGVGIPFTPTWNSRASNRERSRNRSQDSGSGRTG